MSTSFLKRLNVPLLSLLFVSSFLLFFQLGERPFRNPDEGRYAEIAREMVLSGDYVEPTLFGVDYLKKPPLFYWLLSASFNFFGFNEYAARLVPALFALLLVFLTYVFTEKFIGKKAAFFSSLILVTNVWFDALGRYLIIDMVFSFFMVAALFSYFLSLEETSRKNLWLLIFHSLVAISFLTKGLPGIVLPWAVVIAHTFLARRWKSLWKDTRPVWGLLLGIAITGPWLYRISKIEAEFFSIFFVHEHAARFLSSSFEHQSPWYYYLCIVPVMFLPWILFPAIRRAPCFKKNITPDSVAAFSCLSIVVIISIYSLSKGKLLTYMTPIFPFISILLGAAWADWVEDEKHGFWDKIPLILMIFIAVIFLLATDILAPRLLRKLTPEALFWLRAMSLAMIAGGAAGLRSLARNSKERLFYILVIMMSIVSIFFGIAMEKNNALYTTKEFAGYLRRAIKPSEEVYIYGAPGQFYDFAFYLNRSVRLVGLEGELELDIDDTDHQGAFISRDKFFKKWEENNSFYCLLRRSDFSEFQARFRDKVTVLHEDDRKVLFKFPAS